MQHMNPGDIFEAKLRRAQSKEHSKNRFPVKARAVVQSISAIDKFEERLKRKISHARVAVNDYNGDRKECGGSVMPSMASDHIITNGLYDIGREAHQAGVDFRHASTDAKKTLGTSERKNRPKNERKMSHNRTQPHQTVGVSPNENRRNDNMKNASSASLLCSKNKSSRELLNEKLQRKRNETNLDISSHFDGLVASLGEASTDASSLDEKIRLKKMNSQTKNRSKTSIKCVKENPSSSKKAYKNPTSSSNNSADLSDTAKGELGGIIQTMASASLIETNKRSNQLYQSTHVHENDDNMNFRDLYARSKNPGKGGGPSKDLNNSSFTFGELDASSNDGQSSYGVVHEWSDLEDVLKHTAEKSMSTLSNYSTY